MHAIIDDLHKADSYVAVYDNSADISQFKFGKFLCINDSRFAMLLISPNGDYDGIVVNDTEKIFRVDSSGRYHEKIRKLMNFSLESVPLPSFVVFCNILLNYFFTISINTYSALSCVILPC